MSGNGLDVVLRSGPLDELLRLFGVRRAGRYGHGPCPQPVRTNRVTGIRRLGVCNTVYLQEGSSDGGVDPHAALAFVVERQDLVEGVTFRTRRAVVAKQVYIEVDGSFPLVGVDGRLHVLVEPGTAEGIHDSGDERHVVAPAGLTAKAGTIDTLVRVMDGGSGLLDVVPGIVVGDRYAGSVGQVLAVHDHRGLAIERRGIQGAVVRQAVADRRQHVVHVVGCAEIQRLDPAGRTPDRGFLHADVDDVVLATAGRCVRRDLLAQDAFFQRNPVQLDAGIRSIGFGNLLHVDHVAVVHDGNRQLSGESRCRNSSCDGSGHYGSA